MTKTFKLNDTLFFINGEYYLVDKETKIEEGDWLIEKEQIVNQLPNYLVNMDGYHKIISSTNKSLKGIYHFSIEGTVGGKQYSEDDLRKAFEAGRKLTVEGFEEEDFKDLDKFIQSLQPQIQSIEVEYEDNGEEDWVGDDLIGEPFWIEKWEPKLNNKGELNININY